MNAFNQSSSDNSIGARINSAITNAFSFAVVAMVGVMTCGHYLAGLHI